MVRGCRKGSRWGYVSRLSPRRPHRRDGSGCSPSSAASLILAGSLVFYLVRSNVRASEASQAAIAITDMLELSDLEQATEFLEKLEKADPDSSPIPA